METFWFSAFYINEFQFWLNWNLYKLVLSWSVVRNWKPPWRHIWGPDGVIKWKHFPVNSPHKGQSRGALVFSLIYAWTNDWVYNRDASDLGRHNVHYDATLMHMIHMFPLCPRENNKYVVVMWDALVIMAKLWDNTVLEFLCQHKIILNIRRSREFLNLKTVVLMCRKTILYRSSAWPYGYGCCSSNAALRVPVILLT